MKTIINSEDSLPETISFLKKYFKNVRHIKNKLSHLASVSQNFYSTITFENRGVKFKIKWNYHHSEITSNNGFYYSFTKMQHDSCYPIEEGNNSNVCFWEIEIVESHDCEPRIVSPFRIPVDLY